MFGESLASRVSCSVNHQGVSSSGESSLILFLCPLQCGAGARPAERASVGEADSGSRGDRGPDRQQRNGGNGASDEERRAAGPSADSQ